MKQLISLVLFLLLFLEARSSEVSDADNLIDQKQLQRLTTRCSRILPVFNLNLDIHIYSDPFDQPQFSKANQGLTPFVFVTVNRADTSVSVRTANLSPARIRFFENVFFQFLNVPMKEGAPLIPSLDSTLDQIEGELVRRQQAIEQRKIEDQQFDSYDPRAVLFNWLFMGVIIAFMIAFFIRKARIKNKYEARSFYGISRLPMSFTVIFGLIVLFGGSSFLSKFISNGAWSTILMFWLAFVPVMVFLTYLITVVKDLFSVNEYRTEDCKLTLGQMLWLVRPSANTEHLMELTFYEQVFRKKINLEIVSEEFRRRQIHEYYVSPGEKFVADEKFRIDEAPFFKELYVEEERLEPYLHRIYESYGNFLIYRKDHVLKGLFRSGYVTKLGFPFNTFGLTPKGKELQSKLFKIMQKQAELIQEGMKDPSNIPVILPQLTAHVLLINDFERQLTHFYNVVVDVGLLHQAMALPIGVLFHPDFSLRTFNLKLRSAYASMVVREGGNDDGGWDMDFFD